MNSDKARVTSRALSFPAHASRFTTHGSTGLSPFATFAKPLQWCYHSPIIAGKRKETGP